MVAIFCRPRRPSKVASLEATAATVDHDSPPIHESKCFARVDALKRRAGAKMPTARRGRRPPRSGAHSSRKLRWRARARSRALAAMCDGSGQRAIGLRLGAGGGGGEAWATGARSRGGGDDQDDDDVGGSSADSTMTSVCARADSKQRVFMRLQLTAVAAADAAAAATNARSSPIAVCASPCKQTCAFIRREMCQQDGSRLHSCGDSRCSRKTANTIFTPRSAHGDENRRLKNRWRRFASELSVQKLRLLTPRLVLSCSATMPTAQHRARATCKSNSRRVTRLLTARRQSASAPAPISSANARRNLAAIEWPPLKQLRAQRPSSGWSLGLFGPCELATITATR